jgi:hypothetical protein
MARVDQRLRAGSSLPPGKGKRCCGRVACFCEDAEATLWFKERLVVLRREALKKKILDEAHTSRYSIHPRSTMMHHDLRQQFWWTRMKRETTRYVSESGTCQKVKADYMKPGGLLQPLSIPKWKWDDISMDFIVGLPLTARKFDSIWVIVDRLSKSAHFIPINTNYKVRKYTEIYIARVLCLHGVPKMIIFDSGSHLSLAFGSNCTRHLELTWSIVRPITHRRMANLSESTKYSKIC